MVFPPLFTAPFDPWLGTIKLICKRIDLNIHNTKVPSSVNKSTLNDLNPFFILFYPTSKIVILEPKKIILIKECPKEWPYLMIKILLFHFLLEPWYVFVSGGINFSFEVLRKHLLILGFFFDNFCYGLSLMHTHGLI